MMPGEILKYSIEVAVATPSQAVRVTPGRRVTVHSGSDSEVGHWQPRVGPQTDASDRDRHLPRFHDYRNLITITTMGECNGNTRLVGSQGSTETYPSTTRTCITRLGYFPS